MFKSLMNFLAGVVIWCFAMVGLAALGAMAVFLWEVLSGH
jgi:hypothetical protein